MSDPWMNSVFVGPTGPTGPTGATGATGPALEKPAILVPADIVLTPARTILGFMAGASFTVAANSLQLIAAEAVTASDINYWTFAIGQQNTGGGFVVKVTITTRTGGTGNLTAGVPFTLTHASFVMAVGDIGYVTATATGTPEQGSKLIVFPPT